MPVVEKTKSSSVASSGFKVTSMSTSPGAIGTSRTPAAVLRLRQLALVLHE